MTHPVAMPSTARSRAASPITRRRLLLLGILALLALSIAFELALAAALDETCGDYCRTTCENADGCRYFETFGCNCRIQCNDDTQGVRICALTE